MRLRLQQPLLPQSGSHSGPESDGHVLRPNLLEIYWSSYSPFLTSPVCFERLSCEFISRDDKNAVWFRVSNINNSKVSSCVGLSNYDTRTVAAGPVFPRLCEHLFDLMFKDIMSMNVKVRRSRINIIANFQEQLPLRSKSNRHPAYPHVQLSVELDPRFRETPPGQVRAGASRREEYNVRSPVPSRSRDLFQALRAQRRYRTLSQVPDRRAGFDRGRREGERRNSVSQAVVAETTSARTEIVTVTGSAIGSNTESPKLLQSYIPSTNHCCV